MTAQLKKKEVVPFLFLVKGWCSAPVLMWLSQMMQRRCWKKEDDKIEADWSKAQKDILKAKIDVTDSKADIFARE